MIAIVVDPSAKTDKIPNQVFRSTLYQFKNKDIHILGLCCAYRSAMNIK